MLQETVATLVTEKVASSDILLYFGPKKMTNTIVSRPTQSLHNNDDEK